METLINRKVNLILKQLGLKEQEIEAYMILLKKKESSVPSLAKDLNLSKSSAYSLVEKLIQKGFVCYAIKGKRQLIMADDPKKLKMLLEEQEINFKMKKLNVNSFLIPTLEKLGFYNQKSSNIKFYSGISGIKMAFSEVLLKFTDRIDVLMSFKRQKNFLPRSFLKSFYGELGRKKGLLRKILVPEGEKHFTPIIKHYFHRFREEIINLEIKELPILNISEDIFIFKEGALFINFQIKGGFAVVILDKALSLTLSMLFKIIWDQISDI